MCNFQDANDKVVIFSALKTTGGEVTGDLTFDRTEVNIGSAMNVENGEFKAPFSGTYSFVFSALTANKVKQLSIYIRKNGNTINYIYNQMDVESETRYDNISRHWMLNLSKGDIIILNLEAGKLYTTNIPVIFSGHLLHLTE